MEKTGKGIVRFNKVVNFLVQPLIPVIILALIEHFEAHRIKITLISGAGFVFILREVTIGIYNHTMGPLDIAARSLLLLVVSDFPSQEVARIIPFTLVFVRVGHIFG